MDSTMQNAAPKEIRRVPMACLVCRKRKVQCRPSPHDPRRCQRCVTDNTFCEYRPVGASSDHHSHAYSTPIASPSSNTTPTFHVTPELAQVNTNQPFSAIPQPAAYWGSLNESGNVGPPQHSYSQYPGQPYVTYNFVPYVTPGTQPDQQLAYSSPTVWTNQAAPYYYNAFPPGSYSDNAVPSNSSSSYPTAHLQGQTTAWVDHRRTPENADDRCSDSNLVASGVTNNFEDTHLDSGDPDGSIDEQIESRR